MLHFVHGDMFLRAVDIRVNTVNCVGVMGKGVALEFKNRYPKMFLEYRKACRRGDITPGGLWAYKVEMNYTIVNFATKLDWRDPSRYEWIESGLDELHAFLRPLRRVHVTLPPLGCGNGQLEWAKVKAMIEQKLAGLDAEVWVYEP